jgi:ribosome-associated translation inhibitor RaiA
LKIRIDNGSVAVDDLLRAHLARRLDFALSTFGDRVGRIVVRLSQAEPVRAVVGASRSSPAPSTRCEIEVMLRPRSVRVEDTGADLFIAVGNAADRLTRSVARALERERAWKDGHPSPPAGKRLK